MKTYGRNKKRLVNSLIKFAPDKNLVIALGAAALSVMASVLMNLTESEVLRIVLRQLIQVIGISLVFPFFILHCNREFQKASIRLDRPLRYIAISILLSILLFFQMAIDIGLDNIRVTNLVQVEGAFYVMVTNIVEVFFFACFIRYYVEKSLGLISGIVISAAFFSLHHAGFQPEYMKLFIVGLVFITIIRIANHWLIAFPFWWVGGVFDVMFGSEATALVDWTGFTIYSVIILAVILGLFIWKYPHVGNPPL
jgi:hypothetical protein